MSYKDYLSKTEIPCTREDIECRLRGIVASASFEDMNLTKKEISMLRKLGNGEITEEEYDAYYGLIPNKT